VRDEHGHGDVQQQNQRAETQVDRRSGESRATSESALSRSQSCLHVDPNTHYRIENEIRVVAKPRPVAMYLAPPNVKLLRIECM
jgi:hypothetical protein